MNEKILTFEEIKKDFLIGRFLIGDYE